MRMTITSIVFVVFMATTVSNGFSTERLQVKTEQNPGKSDDGDMSEIVEGFQELPVDDIKNSEKKISNKETDDMLVAAHGVLKEERKALADLLTTVQARSVTEMKRLREVSDELEKFIDDKKAAAKTNGGRRHRKRSTFDSISHNGGFGRLGHAESERRRGKLAFTFQNLLPYLLNEQRRSSRAARLRRN